MTEKQLNENLIKLELQDICKDCMYLNEIATIIREMLSEEYKTGLEQSRFDKNMLEQENQELKKQLSNSHQIEAQQKEFIEYLEEPIRMFKQGGSMNISEYTSAKLNTLEEVLSKFKEIIGDKDERI